jgi:hypothetical protein
MNENMDRIKHGWHPRKDANWIWWIIADGIVLTAIAKMRIKQIWHNQKVYEVRTQS